MERTRPKNLVLILARELASNVATPIFVVDHEGTLVFYNEPSEAILGQPFAVAGELPTGEWGSRWAPERLDGSPMPLEEIPLVIAMRSHRPAHATLRIIGSDGVRRTIAATGVPLFASADEYVGALAIFWEHHEAAGL